MDIKRLSTRERKILRMYKAMVEKGLWRVRTNKEMRELHKDLYIVADIKKKRLECNEHVVGMDQKKDS
jgi:hypothetical protein